MKFRKVHHKIVDDYIIKQMQSENKDATGTGGTPLQTYLSGIIHNTKECLVDTEVETKIVYTQSE